jgi:hypothetical protein
MSGRGRGHGRGRGGRGGRAGRNNGDKSSKERNPTKDRKTLADHIYYVGSAKQASDFSVITDFLINHIRQKFEHGNDIANALEKRQKIDFTNQMPTLTISTDQDQAIRTRMN